MLGRFFAVGLAGIYALGDVAALGRDGVEDEHAIGMEDIIIVCVANVADRLAGDGVEIEPRFGRDLASDDDQITFGIGLAGDTAGRILRQAGVEHRIGDGIANFVRVALAHGFGRKDVVFAHVIWLINA